MLEVNETRFLGQNESWECKCWLNEIMCNSKQIWNHDKCCYEPKELRDWSSFKDHNMWNPSTCDCKCNRAGKIDKYLDISNLYV